MKPIEIESWALRVIEQAQRGVQPEGDTVELKAEWPDPVKAARRLAAHANAARGGSILWLIGIDERRGLLGVPPNELATWLPQVQNQFDGVTPSLQAINVTWQGVTVAALCFNTERSPYVVKNAAFGQPQCGPVEWEIPWRDGARTRTARRDELLLLLSPAIQMPKIELMNGGIDYEHESTPKVRHLLRVSAAFYFATPLNTPGLVLPVHKAQVEIVSASEVIARSASIGLLASSQRQDAYSNIVGGHGFTSAAVIGGGELIQATTGELILRGPGKVQLVAICEAATKKLQPQEVRLSLEDAISAMRIQVTCKVGQAKLTNGKKTWPLMP